MARPPADTGVEFFVCQSNAVHAVGHTPLTKADVDNPANVSAQLTTIGQYFGDIYMTGELVRLGVHAGDVGVIVNCAYEWGMLRAG